MPKFSYVAMDSKGKEQKGVLEVANQNEAIARVKSLFGPNRCACPASSPKVRGRMRSASGIAAFCAGSRRTAAVNKVSLGSWPRERTS